MLLFEREEDLQSYKAQSPLQRELFSVSVSAVSELKTCSLKQKFAFSYS